MGEGGEGGELVGHVVGCVELLQGELAYGVAVEFKQVAQAEVAQGTPAGVCGAWLVRALGGEGGVDAGQFAFQFFGQMAAQGIAGGVQGIRIDDFQCFGQR